MDEFVRCIGCGKEDLPQRLLITTDGYAHNNPECAEAWRERNPGQDLPMADGRSEAALMRDPLT